MGNDSNKIYFEVALESAKAAGHLLLTKFDASHTINYKGRIDLVTEMDRASEDLIIKNIQKHFPEHGILAEESGMYESPSEFTWVIDPLDGTTNYAHGFGFFAVSIALLHNTKGLIAAVVFAPYLDECYTAVAGEGAFLNSKSISVSQIDDLERSLLATGFPYDIKESLGNLEYFSRFLPKAQAVRRPGAASIDLCCVAAGKFEGFWELQLKPWDTAAGVLIIQEAGGVVSDFKNNEYDPFRPEILATNGRIHEAMMEVLVDE